MLLSHCTVEVGVPLAAAVKVAVAPATTVVLAGCVVTAGAEFTVSVAAVVVAVPTEFVNTARYCLPLSPAAAVKLYVVLVAPLITDQLGPLRLSHRTMGVGVPLAAAVNVAVSPAFTVVLVGWVVMLGATTVTTVRVAVVEV